MKYQITPNQGKELIIKLKDVALDTSLWEEIKILTQNGYLRFSDSRMDTLKDSSFRDMVFRNNGGERYIETKLQELFPHSFTDFHCTFNSYNDDWLYGAMIVQIPLEDSVWSVYRKENTRETFIQRFEKATNLGINVLLEDAENETLQNCLYPINHKWAEKVLEEARHYPTCTDEQLIAMFDSINMKIGGLVSGPIKKKGLFETLFGD